MIGATPAHGRRGSAQINTRSSPLLSQTRWPMHVRALVSAVAWVLACLLTSGVFAGQWPWSTPLTPPQKPHPAVVRISVEEADGMAHGSGTLVDVRDRFGLVITNWHVVRDATGSVNVVFPDGFRSAARVLRVDRDWDLAALLIWRPHTTPIPLAMQAPRPGEQLTIAGYGTGNYRSVSGRCTQYVAPSGNHPYEMVELAASARQGDSGGPIFNTSGELAGVLFGSGGGTTSGSYAGRVHNFLATVWPPTGNGELAQGLAATSLDPNSQRPLQQLPPQPRESRPAPSMAQLKPLPTSADSRDAASAPPNLPAHARPPTPSGLAATAPSTPNGTPGTSTEALANAELPQPQGTAFTWQDMAGDSVFQQGKTFLAILGMFTLLMQFVRIISPRE